MSWYLGHSVIITLPTCNIMKKGKEHGSYTVCILNFVPDEWECKCEQDTRHTYNITLRCSYITTIALKSNKFSFYSCTTGCCHNIKWNMLPCTCNNESLLYGWATMPTLRLWWIYVSSNNKTYLGLHVKCPKLLSDFNQILIFFWQTVTMVSNIQFHKNMSSGNWFDTCRWTDRQNEANRNFLRVC
jgi:hypothetical protein